MDMIDRVQVMAARHLYNAIDQDGDDWQDLLAGKLFVVEFANYARSLNRELAQIGRCITDMVNVDAIFRTNQWHERMTAVKADKLDDLGFVRQRKQGQLWRVIKIRKPPICQAGQSVLVQTRAV